MWVGESGWRPMLGIFVVRKTPRLIETAAPLQNPFAERTSPHGFLTDLSAPPGSDYSRAGQQASAAVSKDRNPCGRRRSHHRRQRRLLRPRRRGLRLDAGALARGLILSPPGARENRVTSRFSRAKVGRQSKDGRRGDGPRFVVQAEGGERRGLELTNQPKSVSATNPLEHQMKSPQPLKNKQKRTQPPPSPDKPRNAQEIVLGLKRRPNGTLVAN